MRKKHYQYCRYVLVVISIMILTVTVVSCGGGGGSSTSPSTCGGIQVGGYCWYVAAPQESCDQACANRGGCNAAGITYAGSQGSSAACEAVLNALGAPADDMGDGTDELNEPDPTIATGCAVNHTFGVNDRVVFYPATCGASHVDDQRACACNL